MNQASPSPAQEAALTVAAAGALFLLYCIELRWSEAAGPWAPPATLICGLALSAGRGSAGGAALAVWVGLLHAAATAGAPGIAVAATAALAAGLRLLTSEPGRRWALAGPLGWAAAAGLTAAAETFSGGGVEPGWRSLPLAVVVGLLGGGLVAAVGGSSRSADRGWA
ncbi:hypothetical protein [Alienimonas californiensis]|uniref:Uncharacterized protein n=1 Tax=Alienimonas californiensis TaxID=2527989 RepID=A0A517PBY3_9PLAN|nr:hypothetical protein [Alienimonas californiensis]QDT16894.1 hypothetical protein CA12_30020 [Alienimonas californiensis]